jgi:predicted O-methyltransferase YrrM
MSTMPTLVTQELFHYLTSLSTPEDPLLAEIRTKSVEAGLREIWIAREQADFIRILLRLIKAEQVIEVGTYAGYSAMALALGIEPDGHVVSLEINPEHAALAKKLLSASEIGQRVEVVEGDAAQILPSMPDAAFDAAFIDADKANYGLYLKECMRLLRPGGLLMVDNAFAYGKLLAKEEVKDDVWAIRAFNTLMSRQKNVRSLIVPMGDGMWVGVKE